MKCYGLKFPEGGGGDVLKPVPHQHPGEVEICWNQFCARITPTERTVAIINGAMFGAIVGGMLSRNSNAPIAGAILGALIAAKTN